MNKWRVSKEQAGMGLLQFLRETCTEAPSVKAIKRAIDGKQCYVNGRIERFSSYKVVENDHVRLVERMQQECRIGPISVLYEDEDLLIVSKPSGLVSDAESLKKYLKDRVPFFLVHRLDKETSGVLVLVKTKFAEQKMLDLFKKRGIRKVYLALVDGLVTKDSGRIENFLGKIQSYEGQTVYGRVPQIKGKSAITDWKCLKRSQTASLLQCEPQTGRTHQIRVHLSGIGHAILGDAQYGSCVTLRTMLHAYKVVFTHPISEKEIQVIAPIPSDFQQALSKL